MPKLTQLQLSIDIAAPASTVYALMLAPDTYRDWTSAFAEGSHYQGSWDQGQTIRFLAPSGDGMIAEIAENRPNEFVSIRQLGSIVKGVDDTQSDAARAWTPAYENYTFHALPEGTRLVIDQQVPAEYESYMNEAWPKALARLKALCEAATT